MNKFKAIKNLFRQYEAAAVLGRLDLILRNQGIIMSTFDDLKASLDAIVSLVGKVKADVQALHTKLDNIPPAGMTPAQQAALNEATTQAAAIRDSLAGVDDLTADTEAPIPAPQPNV